MAVACLLVDAGVPAAEAIEPATEAITLMHATRHETIECGSQVRWVGEWGRHS
jgi:hypothetical protein